MNKNNFFVKGSIVALITPMFEDGSIDYENLKELVKWHIESKTSAIVSVGTTGESATLNHNEHIAVIKKTVEYADGKIPIIAGTGANSTSEAIELTQEAKNIKADAAILVVPYYNKPTQKGMYLHFEKIAKNVDIPQILYNVPSRTVADIKPETVGKLSLVDNIVGIKDATGSLQTLEYLKKNCVDDFIYLCGDDMITMDFILSGGDGGISVTANVVPKLLQQMYQFALAGDREKSVSIQNKLIPLHNNLFIESNPIPVKWLLNQMGKCRNGIRLPLSILDSDYHNQVLENYKQIVQ